MFYDHIRKCQGLGNYLFEVKEVIDEAENEDVWVVYHTIWDMDKFYSLQSYLWDVQFDPTDKGKAYKVTHGYFYKMLSGHDGKQFVAQIISETCKLL